VLVTLIKPNFFTTLHSLLLNMVQCTSFLLALAVVAATSAIAAPLGGYKPRELEEIGAREHGVANHPQDRASLKRTSKEWEKNTELNKKISREKAQRKATADNLLGVPAQAGNAAQLRKQFIQPLLTPEGYGHSLVIH